MGTDILEKIIFIAHKDNAEKLVSILINNGYNFHYGNLNYSIVENLDYLNNKYIAFYAKKYKNGELDKKSILWGSYKEAINAIEEEEYKGNNTTGFLLTDNHKFIRL